MEKTMERCPRIRDPPAGGCFRVYFATRLRPVLSWAVFCRRHGVSIDYASVQETVHGVCSLWKEQMWSETREEEASDAWEASQRFRRKHGRAR